MKQTMLKTIGFNDKFVSEADSYNGLYAGRVFSQYKDLYKVVTEEGEVMAEVSGKFRFLTKTATNFPAVGDFVMMDRKENAMGNAVIHHVLSRKSVFMRKAAGSTTDGQVVAANIDTVFLCMSLNNDFNLRRLERYLAIAWDSGAVPVVVLTKADLCDELERRLEEVKECAVGTDILVVSAMQDDLYAKVMNYIHQEKTVAFIGSSGVGKSTLINRLIHEERQDIGGLRNDDKGRHTTTRREIILLGNGGMVIDTPGMREIGLESADVAKTFAEIEFFAAQCKFSDCTHEREPGCAVRAAIDSDVLSADRLTSYQKLKKETRYEGLNAREIESMKLDEMFSSIGGMKKARKVLKEKLRRR